MTQEPYRISFDQPPPDSGGTRVYRKSSIGKGCLTIVAFAVLLVILVAAVYFFIYPSLTPNKLRGDFLAAEVVPDKSGEYKVWIQTDGSFNYIKSVKTPGHYSMGKECYFCKTWTYIYDPAEKKILKKIKTSYDGIIPTPSMFYDYGKVWIVSGTFITTEPRINVYNSETADLIMDTRTFTGKHSELASGIVTLRAEKDPPRLVLDTRDGQNGLVYVLKEDKVYGSEQEYRKALQSSGTGEMTVFALGADDMSGPRKKLYKVTGPKSQLEGNTSYESYLSNPHSMEFFLKSTSTPLSQDKAYLEGIILDQDSNGAIVLHQDQAGKKANRMLTCIDASGKEKWTVPQSELFKQLKVDEDDDPFSKIFFMKDKIGAERQGTIVFLKVEGTGLMAFDYNSGKKLWAVEF